MIAVLLLVAAANVPRIDVAFALDTTGSMGDEIDVVKEKIVAIARKVSAGQPRPDVRFGIVAFRDRGDAYVTKAFPFSREIADVQKTLRSLDAEGGGDEPESVAEGLHAAVHQLQWDFSKNTARLIFLVGDAAPHRYPDGKDWRKVTSEAAEKGITINVIACSGLSAEGEHVFERIAKMSDGTLTHLTYTRVAQRADGRKFSVLSEGGKTWVAERELSESEWKKGAAALAKEGKVHVPATPPPPPAAMDAVPMNNLDAEIASSVRAKAESLGVSY
jgi:Mg-chelatase subunit ChlD